MINKEMQKIDRHPRTKGWQKQQVLRYQAPPRYMDNLKSKSTNFISHIFPFFILFYINARNSFENDDRRFKLWGWNVVWARSLDLWFFSENGFKFEVNSKYYMLPLTSISTPNTKWKRLVTHWFLFDKNPIFL